MFPKDQTAYAVDFLIQHWPDCRGARVLSITFMNSTSSTWSPFITLLSIRAQFGKVR